MDQTTLKYICAHDSNITVDWTCTGVKMCLFICVHASVSVCMIIWMHIPCHYCMQLVESISAVVTAYVCVWGGLYLYVVVTLGLCVGRMAPPLMCKPSLSAGRCISTCFLRSASRSIWLVGQQNLLIHLNSPFNALWAKQSAFQGEDSVYNLVQAWPWNTGVRLAWKGQSVQCSFFSEASSTLKQKHSEQLFAIVVNGSVTSPGLVS